MSRIYRYLISLFLLFVLQQHAHAQQFPITASTQIIPPYSVYLPDYAVAGSDKLRVILVQHDLTTPSYDVSLQMTIEKNGTLIMRTASYFRPKPLNLTAGTPVIISGADLSDYLNADNIEFTGGYTRAEYDQSKSLPEGSYRISFTAFDYRRPTVQVSNMGSNIFFFQKSDPPILNMPVCGSRVEKRDPQYLTFNWSSRNTTNSTTEYVFSLYEVKPAGSTPDYIVRSSTPVYTLTTDNTMLIYGPGEPLLIDSMQYVWRVQAKDKNGKDLFSNQGYSTTCTFTYLGVNPFEQLGIGKPTLYGAANGERGINYHWGPGNKYNVAAYRLQYRAAAKDGKEFDWQTKETATDTTCELRSLEPGRTYEARLQWQIAGVYGPYSDTVKVTTDTAKAFVCGDGNAPAASANTKGQPTLIAGDIVRMGHFDVMLTSVTGGNGTFSGRGNIVTSGFGMGLLLEFKDITINTDLIVTKGEMKAVTKGIDQFITDELKTQRGGDDVGQVVTGNVMPDITTTLPVLSPAQVVADVDKGTVTIYKNNDQTVSEVIDLKAKDKELPVVLEDADGRLYNIDKEGKVTFAGQRSDVTVNTKLDITNGRVTFAAADGNKYAFDTWNEAYAGKTVLENSYESLADGAYRVNAKAIVPSALEKVTATLEGSSDTTTIQFISGKGIVYPAERKGNTYTLTITGGPASDAQEIYAVRNKISIGKLLVVSYAPKTKKLVLVPVGYKTTIPVNAIQTALADAYSNIGITYTVSVDESFRYNKTWDTNGDSLLQDSKSAFLSNSFTGEEKALKKAYKNSVDIADDAVYLFVVNEVALGDGDLVGKMPRQSQFGFVFTAGVAEATIARTVAHEVGHGDYTLEHTFSAGIGLTEKTTDNLMDYKDGYRLLKYQWDVVHDPGNVWGLFEDDAESQLQTGKSLFKCVSYTVQTALGGLANRLYLAPDGTVFSLPQGATPSAFFYKDLSKTNKAVRGSLESYVLNKKKYVTAYYIKDGSFAGYALENTNDIAGKSRALKTTDVLNRIEISEDPAVCGITVNGTAYDNYGCACDMYGDNYNHLIKMVEDATDPAVKAAVADICAALAEIPNDALKTNNELFALNYDNADLFWDGMKKTPDPVLSLDDLKELLANLKNLDANVSKLRSCDFKDGQEIVDFVNAHFVVPGSKMSFMSSQQFTGLSVQARVCLIEKLLSGSYEQRHAVASDKFGGQDITLRILENCQSSQDLHDVVLQLYKDDVFYTLLSDTYDFLYLFNGCFSHLCDIITASWLNVEQPNKSQELFKGLIKSGNFLLYDNGYLTAFNKEEFKEKDKKLRFKVSEGALGVTKNFFVNIGRLTLGMEPSDAETFFDRSFGPLDYVVVVPKRDVAAFGTVLKKGQPYILPAIGVYKLFKDDTRQAIGISTALVLNTAACAVGAGAVSSACTISATMEVVAFSAYTFSTYANAAPELAQDHPEIVKATNYITFWIMIGHISKGAIESATAGMPKAMMKDYFEADAAQLGKRSKVMSPEHLEFLEHALKNQTDHAYIGVHGDANGFVMVANGEKVIMDSYGLAEWAMTKGKLVPGQKVVLLSCSDLKSAQMLAEYMDLSVIASEGKVTVYDNGVIHSEKPFYECKRGESPVLFTERIGAAGEPGVMALELGFSEYPCSRMQGFTTFEKAVQQIKDKKTNTTYPSSSINKEIVTIANGGGEVNMRNNSPVLFDHTLTPTSNPNRQNFSVFDGGVEYKIPSAGENYGTYRIVKKLVTPPGTVPEMYIYGYTYDHWKKIYFFIPSL